MNRKIYVLITVLALTLCFSQAYAAKRPVLAAGAGYKKMVNDLCSNYQKLKGTSPELIYGNMARVTSQAKVSGRVDIVIGAKWFLDRSGIKFSKLFTLGSGKLVAAMIPGKKFENSSSLESADIQRIALPDPDRAIYGRAAMAYLKNKGLDKKLKDKLVIVATVPQVASYVISKEVDLGFINLTHALNVKNKIGGYEIIDTADYPAIEIEAGVINESPEVDDFMEFLKSDQAREIITKHGL
ncbi:molybdate ABC transporter substrate-binding protein [Maridesulfovibrio bastinii]|jgi:molybdate transport system substrate-binding protein|uniref:molybdate ABC transporter substrate-binding protein n=1 Tax=Maridesulfovibrio bastinii TaxID=47157 RepID=UPI000402E511|nr:molybdate ABC transporter substrate-binding protein [Maridesulfovibrio bastinii]